MVAPDGPGLAEDVLAAGFSERGHAVKKHSGRRIAAISWIGFIKILRCYVS
jgi:hypothetical protein